MERHRSNAATRSNPGSRSNSGTRSNPTSRSDAAGRPKAKGRPARVAVCTTIALVLFACSPETDPDGAENTSSPTTPNASRSPSETSSSASGTTPASVPGIGEPRVVAEGLESPWSIAFWGQTALISERDSARVLELSAEPEQPGSPRAAREVTTIEDVDPGGEGGLLGLAVKDDHLYAYFTSETDNRIQRFPLVGEPGAVRVGDPETIFQGAPKAGFHNGGRIAFGPDGMLYATLGDAGDRQAAQDRDTLAGKIVRMTPDGEVPEDNPFPDSLVHSYGHRNPQGLGWDAEGTMYATEFGQDTWDELNVIEAGGNYGWPEVEGAAGSGSTEDFVDPVQQWSPDGASPSGLSVTADSIVIANLRGQLLREVPLDDLNESKEHLSGEFGRLRDVVTTPDGRLWVLTNNTDGRGEPGNTDDRILDVTSGSR